MNIVKIFCALLLLSTTAHAVETCKVNGKTAAMVFVYCPASMKIEDVTTVLKSFAEIHFNKQQNQVHLIVFNDLKATPQSTGGLMDLSDELDAKHRIGEYSVNKNNGFIEYMCARKKGAKMVKCNDLLK